MPETLVAVIPAFNCVATIGRVVAGTLRHVAAVVVVDDGSTDGTGEAAAAAGAAVARLNENQGKGVALVHGIEQALLRDPAAVVLLDGDGQHDPADVPRLVQAWRDSGADLVVGSRMAEPESIPRARYWTNRIGSRILSWMTGYDLEDSQSGFRLLTAELLRRMPLRAPGYAIESEMLIKAAHRRARLEQAPIRTIYEGGRSHYRPLTDTVGIVLWAIYFQVWDEA
ncbi:MAG TPA: glycosyltransferase family 2 protein [Thermoanaerobaculia bacterium]|nr:glycosyltransferase family 2 protein [Thermoanaerobaculia bacterium]